MKQTIDSFFNRTDHSEALVPPQSQISEENNSDEESAGWKGRQERLTQLTLLWHCKERTPRVVCTAVTAWNELHSYREFRSAVDMQLKTKLVWILEREPSDFPSSLQFLLCFFCLIMSDRVFCYFTVKHNKSNSNYPCVSDRTAELSKSLFKLWLNCDNTFHNPSLRI